MWNEFDDIVLNENVEPAEVVAGSDHPHRVTVTVTFCSDD